MTDLAGLDLSMSGHDDRDALLISEAIAVNLLPKHPQKTRLRSSGPNLSAAAEYFRSVCSG
jgi:hypothetical protein